MPIDRKSEKPESVTNTTEKAQFDYAKGLRNADLSSPTERSIDAPQTHEDVMGLVWREAIKRNELGDRLQKNGNNTPDPPTSDVSALDGQEAVARLQQVKDHLKSSDQPPSIQEIVRDFQSIVDMNLIGMEEVMSNARKNGSIRKPDVTKMHSRIFGSIGASGGYYLYIKNNIPLPSFKQQESTAKLLLGRPIGKFQKVLQDFTRELDKAFPWKYEDSVGPVFGIEPSQPSTFDQKTALSSDDQKRLEDKYKAVSETGKALSKRLEYIIALGTSIEKWEEAVKR